MHDNGPGLFNLPGAATETPAPAVREELRISADQVAQLRAAFDAAGISKMGARQEIIESCTIRPVANIRELFARDFRPILKRIEERSRSTGPAAGSAWDNREEDTWIDKL